jgi:hypothetical protein
MEAGIPQMTPEVANFCAFPAFRQAKRAARIVGTVNVAGT